MTNSKSISSKQPSATAGHSQNWQNIIWREWRNCDDEEYARRLFELVVDKPTEWWTVMISALLGLLYGVLAGCLLTVLLNLRQISQYCFHPEDGAAGWLTLLFCLWNLDPGLIDWKITELMLVGGVGGLLLALGLRLRQWSSWGLWLEGLIPNRRVLDEWFGVSLDRLYFGLVVVLSSGMGVGITGALFFGQPNPQFYILLLGLLGLSIIALFSNWPGTPGTLDELFVGGMIGGLVGGLLFGLFFGLGAAQVTGLLIGPFDVPNSALLVGLAVGIVAGLFFGRETGLIGLLAGQVMMMILVLAFGFNLVLVGWLFGLLVGGLLGGVSKMCLPADKSRFVEAYAYRAWYFWWRERPPATVVQATLRQHAAGPVWTDLFLHLETDRELSQSISDLQSDDWVDRFAAHQNIVTLGSEALPHLLALASKEPNPLRRVALWLARSIDYETTTRLARQDMLCPQCLTGCDSHIVKHFNLSATYYGCRTCRQSRKILHCPQGIVAELNTGWTEAQSYQDGLLRINWLAQRSLFDFNRVEIIQATDEDVERFAVQVGNDTDPIRDARYPQMRCLIAPQCRLSENTLRILQSTFGQVERKEEVIG